MIAPSTGGWVGRSIKRKEDIALLRGRGKYLGDRPNPRGTLHVGIVRSTHAHARIRSVDLGPALTMPGVVSGFTGADIARDVPALLVDSLRPMLAGTLQVPPSPLVAVDKVVFDGEPVAVLLAQDPRLLDDALCAVQVDYEPLPAVLDPELAVSPDAPVIFDGWQDNVLYRETLGNDVSEAFATAEVIVEQRFEVPRTGASPMEGRGALAEWDEAEGLTIHVKVQRPHILRLAISELLDIPHHMVRVIAPHNQGGGFGTHAPISREDILISLLARKIGKPLRWTESRADAFRAGIGQERGQVHYLEIASTRDGRILGLRDRMYADSGCGNSGVYLGFVMPWLGAAYLPNSYDIPNVQVDLVCAVTNKPPLNPSRSFGELPARFAMDSLLDMLADELKMEPAELRRINMVTEFPHITATGIGYDSGDYVAGFDAVVEAIDLEAFRKVQVEERAKGRYLGVGFATGVEMSGLSSAVFVPMENQPGFGAATVKVEATGMVTISIGDAPQGQSHETTLAQVAADELGITPTEITLRYGDTWTTPFGSGTLGNRSAPYTVSAVAMACREIKVKAATMAAHDLGVTALPEDFDFVDQLIVLRADPTVRITLAQVARRLIMMPINLPAAMAPGLEHTSYYEPEFPSMMASGFHAAIVEVDRDTGAVTVLRYVAAEDSGREINPVVVAGQVHGGISCGIANATLEEFVYDADGRLLTTTLQDYLMPSAADVPPMEHIDVSVPSPYTPLGTRGKGEGVPGPVPAALANAVSDAVGARVTTLPMTAQRVWEAMRAAAP